ncbi:MAG TPA: hypothetical protein PKA45_10155, partial [Cyclobacteriaceae bacterium]|nr:hypothetical protein [Cyclobacteriaceae bacterium]
MTASLRRIKKARYFTLPLLALIVLVSFAADPGVIETLLKKLQQYHADRPQEKIYIHHDKPFYAAGDNLWFKA